MIRGTFLTFLLIVAAVAADAAQHWIRVKTSHFEMYTTNGERQAVRSLQGFEQVRGFFMQKNTNKDAGEARVRIIAFSSEKEYRPYRLNEGSFAYYEQSHERDYIVMQDIAPEHAQAAVHEYTHLIVQHAKLKLPVWLNEGMADVYSSLEPRGDQAMVGRPLPGHVMTLANHGFMDWNVLFAVDQTSPYYNQKDKMDIFYSQSWALTDMLMLGHQYQPGYLKFMSAVADGMPTAEALQKVYGKSVAEVGKDVENYLRQSTVQAQLFDIKLAKMDLSPEVSDLTPFQTDLALAELLSDRPETAGEAKRRLLELEKENPGNAEVEQSLGYLAWQQNDIPETVKHFGNAVEHGSKNAEMMVQYGLLLHNSGGSYDAVSKVMEQALEIEPENNEARVNLAGIQLEARHWGEVMATLAPIHKVQPDLAFRFFATTAMARANLKDFEGGKSNAERALKYADTAEERQQISGLLDWIAQASKPVQASLAAVPESGASGGDMTEQRPVLTRRGGEMELNPGLPRVKGTMKSFECVAGGGYRLHLQTAGKEMVFAMPDPKDIVVRNAEGGMVEWSCGPLKPQELTVVYKTAVEKKADGVVAELIF